MYVNVGRNDRDISREFLSQIYGIFLEVHNDILIDLRTVLVEVSSQFNFWYICFPTIGSIWVTSLGKVADFRLEVSMIINHGDARRSSHRRQILI